MVDEIFSQGGWFWVSAKAESLVRNITMKVKPEVRKVKKEDIYQM